VRQVRLGEPTYIMNRQLWILLIISCLPAFAGCGSSTPSSKPSADLGKIEKPGLHNVYRITEKLISGSSPEGDDGFRSLAELGVKTIITVDGAKPDVERARKFGLRYVHLPFGYDGISQQRVFELAKAVRDLPGPIYLHCHHGKHRGPAAAAAVHLCLDSRCTVEQAIDEMKRAGTDPHYTGLFKVPRDIARPTNEELDRLEVAYPEVAEVPELAQSMVTIDNRWENLKRIRAAGWKAPPREPDLDPPHEALQLREHYREAARLPSVAGGPEEMRKWIREAGEKARLLEESLRKQQPDEEVFRQSAAACTACHAKYRDVKSSTPGK
jgi:protein tyrosine phosphatase (PTP) superfamily phosphohydrolase (DUF442 family)